MTMSDPIADMLTRIRNANTAKHDTVDVPASKMKISIAEILLKEGYIKNFEVVDVDNFKSIHITMKYGKDKNEKNNYPVLMNKYLPQLFHRWLHIYCKDPPDNHMNGNHSQYRY